MVTPRETLWLTRSILGEHWFQMFLKYHLLSLNLFQSIFLIHSWCFRWHMFTSIERTCPIFEEGKETCETSDVSCKTIWWNKCKWIRNMWIAFQLKLMGLNMKAVKHSGGKSVASREATSVLFSSVLHSWKWPNTLNSTSFRVPLKSNNGVIEWDNSIQINFIALSGSSYNVGIKHCHCAIFQKHFQFEVRGFSILFWG